MERGYQICKHLDSFDLRCESGEYVYVCQTLLVWVLDDVIMLFNNSLARSVWLNMYVSYYMPSLILISDTHITVDSGY